MDSTHPLRVTLSQIVINRNDMNALACQRIEVCGQHTGQGLTFTSTHLGNVTEVQCRTAHNLDAEVLLPQHAPGCLACRGESIQQQIVYIGTVSQLLLKLLGLGTEFIV